MSAEPDGWCWTCRTVPCVCGKPGSGPATGGGTKQLDRIESKLNRLLRAVNLDPDQAPDRRVGDTVT